MINPKNLKNSVFKHHGKPLSEDNTKYEKCIICHDLTDVLIDMPIECRENYVEGLGQLCDKCKKCSENFL